MLTTNSNTAANAQRPVVRSTLSAPGGNLTTRTAASQSCLPIKGILCCSALLSVVVADVVSENPYPSRITMPGNFSSNARITSPAMAASQDTPTRSAERSRPSVSACSSARYIVGTPENIVQRRRASSSTTVWAWNPGTRTRVPPNRTATLSPLDRPKT